MKKLRKDNKYVEFLKSSKSETILKTYLESFNNRRRIEIKEDSAHLYPVDTIVRHKLSTNKIAKIFTLVCFLTIEDGIYKNRVAVSEITRCHISLSILEQEKFRNTNTDEAFIPGIHLEGLKAIFNMVQSAKELTYPAVVIEINSWLIAAAAANASKSQTLNQKIIKWRDLAQ